VKRLCLVLLIVVSVVAIPRAPSTADPGDDELSQVLQTKDGDTEAVKKFKDTGKNPYNHDAYATAARVKLARAYACTHCHSGALSGLIGPNLTSANLRLLRNRTSMLMRHPPYCGTGAGMAAWGKLGALTEDEILKVIAFVRSKYRGKDITWE